ncbi:hypothetical protein ACQ858_20970 [Variovorax ureilyticus]|uniref:hypothetical protein n=1 Tax=Variovorax ureilyticus TaxID=1836198 RepID=UPI003D67E5C0
MGENLLNFANSLKSLGAAVLLLGLAACGGGGGGGVMQAQASGSPSSSSTSSSPETPAQTSAEPLNSGVQVSFDTSSLAMEYKMGASAPASAVINAVAQGKTSGKSLFVVATTPTGQPDPNIEGVQVTVTGTTARIVVTPKTALAPDLHKGTLVLRACPDAACSVEYPGSPWSVNYSLTVTMTYAALDTSSLGTPRTLIYDAVHGDIYASYPTYASVGLSAVARFRSGPTGWGYTTLSMPGLMDIAMPPDGSVLAATDSAKVSLIELASFSVKRSVAAPFTIADSGSATEVGVAFTKDNKLWMATGSFSWHGLGFFDLRTSTFGSSTACTTCYGGQFFAVSRDGSRLMLTQSAAVSPRPPMLYMDADEGVFRPNPIGLEFFYFLTSLSDNGDRFLMSGYDVYDRNFGHVGSVPQPSKGVRAAQMSPDGRRAYLLSYAVEPGDSTPPTVQVFDTAANAGTQLSVPLVGSFVIPDLPGCQTSTYPYYECYRPRMRLTPDGNNLLILGDRKLIIAPIPKTLSGL